MADLTHQIQDDDHLAAQLAAREVASRQDAAVLAPLRSEAAARALGLAMARPAPPDAAPCVIPDPPAPIAPITATDPAAAPAAATPTPSPGPWPMPGPNDAAPVAAEPPKGFPPPGVIVPTGGPARVTTGVLAAAAAAAQRSKPERPVMELRATVLATDIDRIGDQLVVMKDRLELRDRHGGLRRTLNLADINDVQVQRRLTTAVLIVTTRMATDLVIKGLRPESAESAREAILRLRPTEAPLVNAVDERALMRAVVELHRAGVLDDAELAEKTALVARMAGRSVRH